MVNILFSDIGYIGGTVIARLLSHENASSFDITVLVRSADKAAKLQTLGIRTILGSYTEKLETLTEVASCADVIITIVRLSYTCLFYSIITLVQGRFRQFACCSGHFGWHQD